MVSRARAQPEESTPVQKKKCLPSSWLEAPVAWWSAGLERAIVTKTNGPACWHPTCQLLAPERLGFLVAGILVASCWHRIAWGFPQLAS